MSAIVVWPEPRSMNNSPAASRMRRWFSLARSRRRLAAEHAMHQGGAEPRLAIWSRHDPVSLFGAAVPIRTGWPDVSRTFRWVASRFSDSADYRFDVVAAGTSGDLAYTIGFEHNTVRINGKPTSYTHRHGDHVPEDGEADQSHRLLRTLLRAHMVAPRMAG